MHGTEHRTTRTELARSAVLARIGARRVALAAEHTLEVVRGPDATPVPCDDPSIVEVALLRARVVPLIALGRRLGVTGSSPASCVVLATADGDVGLLVDEVLGLVAGGRNGTFDGTPLLAIDRILAADG